MAEWQTVKFKDIAEFNPKESIKKGTIAVKVGMDKLQPFCRDIPEIEHEVFSGGTKFRNGDTIMARITPCLENGKTAMVNVLKEDEVGFGSTEYIVYRAIKGITDPYFLYYLVCSPTVRDPAIKSMVGSSGRQRVQTDVVQNLELTIPPYEEQKIIGCFLKKIDDKIAVNNRINRNLSEQAQALFEQEVCNASEERSIEELADVKGGKRLPKGINLQTIPNEHPYIRIRDLSDAWIIQLNSAFEYVDDENQKSISRYIVDEKDILISIVGTIGLSAMVHKSLAKANLTENCVKLTNLKEISSEYLLLYIRSQAGQNAIAQGTVGAVQPKLPIKNIQAIKVPIIEEDRMQKLNAIIRTYFDKIADNLAENARLAEIRDALLPKLMSGELDVSDLNV